MVRKPLLTLLLLLVPVLVQAQTVPTYQARYYQSGGTTPLPQTDSFLLTAATCNQISAPTVTSSINPTTFVFDDPANVGKVCSYRVPATGGLFTLPTPGSYEGTLTVTDDAGTSPESNRSPFLRSNVRPAPTGYRIIR